MGTIKIFLASSSELVDERKEFEIFINRKNNEWKRKGVTLELMIWEDFLDAVSQTRSQDEYNKAIRECDIFVMLFFTKVGKYTEEEFDIAYAHFIANGKPRIFTYFKDEKISSASINKTDRQSLWAFQEKLYKLGHFYSVIESIAELKLDFTEQLDKLAAEGFIKFNEPTSNDQFPKELTLSIPKTHPNDIVGREQDLDEFHELLCTEKRVVVVNGLGGIGKTTLVQVYVSKYYDEYKHIAWITQSSDNITNDFLNADGLIQNLNVRTDILEPEQIFKEIIRKLKSIHHKPNLLIIDNAEQSVKQYLNILPGQPQWHLLVTSREDIQGFYMKPLDFLNEDKAVELFKKHYTRQKLNEQEIKELVKAVDFHTLTIEILAKTAQVQRYDAATLKQAVEKDLRANISASHNPQVKIENVRTYLSMVFNLSRLQENEIWLLKNLACLPSEFHHYNTLHELIVNEKSTYKESFAETLNGLTEKGWLLNNKESDSYKLHRIIADVVKKEQSISSSDVAGLIDTITQKLKVDQTKDNPVDKFIWVPYGKDLLANFQEDTSAEIATLLNHLAMRLYDLGDYSGAKPLMEKALLLANKKNFGKDHLINIAIFSSNLALVFQELGDYKRAKSMLKKVIISIKKKLGKDHLNTAVSYSNLASVHKNLGDYKRAKSLLEKVIISIEKDFGNEHPTTAISYSNLAGVLKDLGDYEGAKSLLEKAMLSDEKNFGKDHPTTAIRYHNLSSVLKDLGDFSRALELSDKALAIVKKVLPEGHPYIRYAYDNYLSIKVEIEKRNKT